MCKCSEQNHSTPFLLWPCMSLLTRRNVLCLVRRDTGSDAKIHHVGNKKKK